MDITSDLERELENKIDPWLAHMRWRKDFDQWRAKRVWQEKYQAQALGDVARYADSLLGKHVLDLGAGMGGFAVALAQTGARVTAMDYNPAYCEITRLRARRYALDLPTLAGAGENLPFADAAFDALTCWDVIEHVQDPARLLAEIARVTKPGAFVFITIINRFALVDPHYHLRFVNYLPRALAEKYIAARERAKDSALRDRQRLSEMHYFTFGAFQNLAARSGFTVRDLNEPRSRFVKTLPRPLGIFVYRLWRALGMGTYQLVMQNARRVV